MQFNEFNRRLEKCHLDEDTKYLLSHMFEVQIEFSRQLDMASNIINALVETVQQFAQLHESTQNKVKALMQNQHAEVRSVRRDEDF
jgi:hypothetical protein